MGDRTDPGRRASSLNGRQPDVPDVPDQAAVPGGQQPQPSDAPVTTLRGAGVDVDPRRARAVAAVVAVAVVAVVGVVLLIVGIQKNSQADNLRRHGVPVEVAVSGCLGLLGGSGSNAAGYSCKGTYVYAGRHYERSIPGDSLRRPGSVVQGVVVPGDPGLLSTPALVAGERASSKVFVAPGVLLALAVVAVVLLAVRHRRDNRRRAVGG